MLACPLADRKLGRCLLGGWALQMLLSNAIRIPTVQALSRIIAVLGVLFIGSVCTAAAYCYFENGPQFQAGGEAQLNEPLLPAAFVFVLSSMVGVAFTSAPTSPFPRSPISQHMLPTRNFGRLGASPELGPTSRSFG